MNRETRLALSRPHVRRGLWWAWFGGGLIWTAAVEAPNAIHVAWGLSGPAVPAATVWLALAAGLLARRLRAAPAGGALAAIAPLAVSGITPTPLVVAAGLLVVGMAGGWVVGAVCDRASSPDPSGPAGAGLSLLAAAGGLVLLPLSSLWVATAGGVLLLTGSRRGIERARPPRRLPEGVGLLQARDLTLSFGQRSVLGGASLDLSPGELVVLVGANGSGKSTLLRVLGGHLLPATGQIDLGGQAVLGAAPEEMARLGVTLASGSRPVFPDLTVRENMAVAAWVAGGSRRQRQERAVAALARFPELAPLSSTPAGTLSGGEQRLLALAQSLLTQPTVLLADEITLGLAAQARANALRMLRGVADAGAAVLVVDHELRDLIPLADRVLLLEEGRVDAYDEMRAVTAQFIPRLAR